MPQNMFNPLTLTDKTHNTMCNMSNKWPHLCSAPRMVDDT